MTDPGRGRDQCCGALLGLAVGDALGAAVEFQPPGTFAPVTGYRGGGPHGLEPGEWTDDTAMALALADSIAQAGWDLNDQARRYVRWWRQGAYSVNGTCFDIGTTTAAALARFEQHGDARRSGDPSEQASGNGSIMRLAPVAIRHADLYPNDVHKLGDLAEESSLPTHASGPCRSACRYLGLVLGALIRGEDRETVLDPDWPPLHELHGVSPLDPGVLEVARGTFREKQPPTIEGSGYVVRSLEAALWAFHDAGDFSEAVLRAVNLGDDADTTGAVCGQLAGACWGERGIPRNWLEGLGGREMIEAALAKLAGPADDHPPGAVTLGDDESVERRLADHDRLLRQMRERIEVAYLRALKQKLVDPVVLVLDLQDRLAERFIRGTGREPEADAMIAQAARQGVRAVAAWHVPAAFAARLFDAEGNTGVATMLRAYNMPAGSFAVVVAADGGISVAACPAPPD